MRLIRTCAVISGFKCGVTRTQLTRRYGQSSVTSRVHVDHNLLGLEPRASVLQFASSLENGAETDFIGLVKDDLVKFNDDIQKTLAKNITNKEMYDIAMHKYTGHNSQSGLWITMPLLIGKALNYHQCNDGTLTESQSKLITIMELMMSTLSMHDDVADNSKTRRGKPSSNVVWYPYKSIVAGNMMYAISLNEANKLNNADITVSISKVYENFCRGQYMQCQKLPHGKDRLEHYLEKTNLKSGGAVAYGLRAMAQAVGASDALTEVVMKYAQNVSNVGQLLDDLMDFEEDLKEGVATAPVILASREHPVLEEIMARDFQQDGDVEKAVQLVKQSRGFAEAQKLANSYCTDAMRYAKLFAVSPYQKMLEILVLYFKYRTEHAKEKQKVDDRIF